MHKNSNLSVIVLAAAVVTLCANVKGEELLPIGNGAARFSVRTDSLWLNVAWSRLIVVATPEHVGHDEKYDCEKYRLHVSEVLKGDAGATNLTLRSSESSFEGDDFEILSKGGRVIAFLSYDGASAKDGEVHYPSSWTSRSVFRHEAPFAERIRREVEEQRKTVEYFHDMQKAKLPFWDEVTNLVQKLTVSPAEQAEAVVVLRAHWADFLPAMIAAMDDDRSLADHVLYGGYRDRTLIRHAEKVVDVLATIVSDCTQIDIADLNAYSLSDEDRRHCVAVWQVFLDHWLRTSSGETPLRGLEVLSPIYLRNQKKDVWTGLELPEGVTALSEEEWTRKLADVMGADAEYVSFELSRGLSSEVRTNPYVDVGNFHVVVRPDFEKEIDVFAETVCRKEDDDSRYVRECVFSVRKGSRSLAEIEREIADLKPWTWGAVASDAKHYGTEGRFSGRKWNCRFPRMNGTNDLIFAAATLRDFLSKKWGLVMENAESVRPDQSSNEFRF